MESSDDRDDPEPALGARPESDRVALAVARARMMNRLFADDRHVEVGRYRLLERVGAGGMGVVWGAWDPELKRRVAIKLVRTSGAQDRILEEGQALARLSHPNVIPVYDVGVVEDQVYLVMEWVPGTNLRVHCREPRSVRELVALYRAAGDGLLAAHAAGLVHRDFKPENVMVGSDGRVRVLDFGIAVARDEAGAAVPAGTPRYMAPEQVRGGAITPAVDQYAFCVALREALVNRAGDGEHAAVPAWLDAITTRGAADDPAARYPGMADVLHALARDPAVVRRRRFFIAGAVAAAATAFAVGTLRGGGDLEVCTGSSDEIAAVWNDGARATLQAHTRGLGAYGVEEGARLDRELAEYGARWVGAHRGACLAHARGELTNLVYERDLACLARAHAAFGIVVDVASRSPAERFPNAVLAERGLPAIERCALDAESATVGPPNPAIAAIVDRLGTELARARYLSLANDPGAAGVATAAADVAQRLGYLPLVAHAELERGAALANEPATHADSVRAYERATAAALEAGDDLAFVEAYARELFVLPQTREPPGDVVNTSATLPFAQRIARRTGAVGTFARTLLYNNAGTERLAAGDVPGARKWFRLALDEPHAGEREIELWAIDGNLAMTVDDPAERARLFREERDHLVRALGPHHAFTLTARLRESQFVEDRRIAIPELREICDAIRDYHPDAARIVGRCGFELGWLAEEAGDREGARAAMAMAQTGDNAELARIYIRLLDGHVAEATAAADAAATRLASDPAWWIRFSAVNALIVVAIGRAQLHEPAIAALRRALAVLQDPQFNHGATYYLRRLARVRAMLARALAATDHAAAAALATDALAWYRRAGGYDDVIAELVAITGSR